MEDLFSGNSALEALPHTHFVSAKKVADGLQTPLGAVETWSSSLQSAFSLLLNSCSPMFLVWNCDSTQSCSGERILFFNDAYLSLFPVISLDHFSHDSWTEVWRTIQAEVEQVFTTGKVLQRQINSFFPNSNDKGNEFLYPWSYSAVWNETGHIRGVFATRYQISTEGIAAPTKEYEQQAEIERVHLVEELASERARFEAVLSQMPEGVIIADAASGKMILANERTHQIFQYSYELNLELPQYDYQVPFYAYHPNGQVYEADDYPLMRSLKTGEVITHEEIEIRFLDGRQIVINANSSPIFDSDGKITSAIVLIEDITERKQIEQALRTSETLHRTISEAVPDFIWSCDENGQADFVNPRWMEYTGLTIEELNAGGLAQINHPEDFPRLMEQWEIAKQRAEPWEAEFRYRRQDGVYRWFMGRSVPLKDNNGKIIRWIGTTTDIHNRKLVEEALRQSEERYRYLAELIPQLVWTANAEGVLVDTNQRWSTFTGLTLLQAKTEGWQAIVHPDDVSVLNQNWLMAQQDGNFYSAEGRIRRVDGVYRWHLHQAIPLKNEQGQLIKWFGTATDIEDQKQLEQQRLHLLQHEQAAREHAEAAGQRIKFLAAISTTLASSLDYEYTLSSVAQAVVPLLADWCAVDILQEDGTLGRLATAHVDPAKVQWGLELHHRYPPDFNSPRGIAQVLRTGQSEYYPRISDQQIVAAARDEEHLKLLREIGFSSVMLVPLNAHGKTLGTISFVAAESGRSYSLEDLALAEELAWRAAIALENARLYQEAQQARLVAGV